MKNNGSTTFKHGNKNGKGRPQNSPNKRLVEIHRIGEDNCISLYNLQLEIAMTASDANVRSQAQQFLLNKILPNAKSRKITIDLKPMDSLNDITDNENIVIQSVADGDITVDECEKFFSILEHCRKTKEAIVIGEEIQEIKQFIKESKRQRG